MNENKFSAPQDIVVKIVTNGMFIICLLLFYHLLRNGFNTFSVALVVILPVVILAWCFHPQYYELTDLGVKIKWPLGKLFIPYRNITKAGSLTKADLGPCIRLFACGGLFGYFGWYFSKNIGRFYMWCANKKDMIAIMADTARIVIISPNDSKTFLETLNKRLH